MQKLHSLPVWQEIQQQFAATGEAAPVLSGLTDVIQQMTVEAFEASLSQLTDPNIAMLAVGGFGRRELFPYSDVDVLILVERESQTTALKDALSEFVRLLWDAGLRLSHSVRTIPECSQVHEHNIELNISLVDCRFLDGSAETYAKLESKLPAFFERHGRTLIRELCRMSRTRHNKFQQTLYHLEPDIKETPGGLRDLHLIHWLTKLRRGNGQVSPELGEPSAFLQSLRC